MDLLQEAKIQNIANKINNGKCLNLNINYYQRPYRWPDKKILDLFDDYKENKRQEEKKDYFFGAVVLVIKETESDNISEYQVVDGQQRLTTLFLFNYLKFLLLSYKASEYAEQASNWLPSCLEKLEKCYFGFIGKNKNDIIKTANKELIDAEDKYNQSYKDDTDKVEYDKAKRKWRESVGLPEIIDLADEDYLKKCIDARSAFLADEELRLHYENDSFNEIIADKISKIVISCSKSYSPKIEKDYFDEVDSNEWPFLGRAWNIFDQIVLDEEVKSQADPMDQIDKCIELIDEMLENIKLCLIITRSEDDAYKLFETLNDRSESVSDLELIKDYFYKTYTIHSGETKRDRISKIIAQMDNLWKEEIFSNDNLKEIISHCMAVFLTGGKDLKQNDAKRKSIQNNYLNKYNKNGKRYTEDLIKRDFEYFCFIKKTVDKIIDKKSKNNKNLSLIAENSTDASVVRRALALSIHLDYLSVFSGIICDVISTYVNSGENDFSEYLDDVLKENECINKYKRLWEDCNIIWKTIIMSKDYQMPKKYSDKLIDTYNISNIDKNGNNLSQLQIEDDDKDKLSHEFETWLGEWTWSNSVGKIKIKNLFIHLFDRYDKDNENSVLTYKKTNYRRFKDEAINQDLDHMDAKTINKDERKKYFSYDNSGNRVAYINGLGNMMPLPEKLNRGKKNTSVIETLNVYKKENLNEWIFDEAKKLFDKNNKNKSGYRVPTNEFFTERKDRLIQYFKLIVENQKANPKDSLSINL